MLWKLVLIHINSLFTLINSTKINDGIRHVIRRSFFFYPSDPALEIVAAKLNDLMPKGIPVSSQIFLFHSQNLSSHFLEILPWATIIHLATILSQFPHGQTKPNLRFPYKQANSLRIMN